MQPTLINSSNIDAVGFEPAAKGLGALFIRFKSGITYSYDDAPYTYFSALQRVESAGQFFHRHIRGKFHYTKLEGDPFNGA